MMPLYAAERLTVSAAADGDVKARFLVRIQEIEQSFRLMTRVIQKLQGTSTPAPWDPPDDLDGHAVAYAESPHGLNAHVVAVANGKIRRYHVRSGSPRNWPLLAVAVAGNAVGDFPLINKSFELCYSCLDR
jgi:Ni,Fe-hydrogenase III large subunit